MSRKSYGRQKIEMTKMKKESNLQVTFSKRRAGLFKKASELCTLTGAEVAILVFSPGKKAFSFGHPGVAPVIDRFLFEENSNALEAPDPMKHFIEAYRNENVRDLNVRLSQVLQELEIEKKKGEELTRIRKLSNNQGLNWWESPIEELTLPQLEQLKASLEELKKEVSIQKENLNILQASYHPPPLLLPPPTVELPTTHYASSSANVNVNFSQPFNLNFPYLEHNFSAGTNSNIANETGFSTGYYMK